LVPIPEELCEAMREVREMLRDAERDPDVRIDYGDAIQTERVCGGRYRGGKRPFDFVYLPAGARRRIAG